MSLDALYPTTLPTIQTEAGAAGAADFTRLFDDLFGDLQTIDLLTGMVGVGGADAVSVSSAVADTHGATSAVQAPDGDDSRSDGCRAALRFGKQTDKGYDIDRSLSPVRGEGGGLN
jgi:hypothetical protein